MVKGCVGVRNAGGIEEAGLLSTAILSISAGQLPGDALWNAIFYTAGGLLGLSCVLQLRVMAVLPWHATPSWQRAANILRHLAFLMVAGYALYGCILEMSRDASLLFV